VTVTAPATRVLPRFLDHLYPEVVRGAGVRLWTSDDREVLDACSGGAMVASLGHGRQEIVAAASAQAQRIPYVYDHHFTNEPKERFAERLLELAAPEMARVRFSSGGAEANETALRLARAYHFDRGEERRTRIISFAQAYHGATFATLSLTGRRTVREPFEPYLFADLHIPPSTWRSDPSGQAALDALDRALGQAGADTVAAFFCEPIGAAALPAHREPDRFWEGLAERRERHGFLVCFDEIVTSMGRTGTWFAYQQLPLEPDIVTAGKGLGCGYAPLSATLCREHVYQALAEGSRVFDLGHTWDGAPLPCAVGLSVLELMLSERLVERVRERGPSLLQSLKEGLNGLEIVRSVRGHGFLLGIELVDPRDGESPLPHALHAAELVDDVAFEHGVLVTSSHSQPDGYTGDETLLAPAYTATDEELAEMVARVAEALADVQQRLLREL
jgi:adenosylmethionine-8-amino-7-oxononanoate aminotransferase